MLFLVIDDRFGAPIHVFLEVDPQGSADYPGLPVREVRLEPMPPGQRRGAYGPAIGQDPREPAAFREFGSDRAVAVARHALVEPRYVGLTWATYLTNYRPAGGTPHHRPSRSPGPRPRRKPAASGG